MKITHAKSSQLRYSWLEILFKSANQNILLSLDSFEKPYKQLELVFHRGLSIHSKTMDKNNRAARSCFHHCFLVFGCPGETLAVVVHNMKLFQIKYETTNPILF